MSRVAVAIVLCFAVAALSVDPAAVVQVATQSSSSSSSAASEEVWSASSLFGRTLAQATCSSISRTSGATYAVRRECNEEAADCHTICGGLKDTEEKDAEFTCENSLHISNGEGSDLPGQLGLKTFRYNSCRVKGCGPNFCCCNLKSQIQYLIRPTCKDILKSGESKGTGVYLVNPKGTADGAFKVYCDMVTDGGGWTLFASYSHNPGETRDLNEYEMPTSVDDGWSHRLLDAAGFIDEDVSEIRFYCETSAHPRRIHFSTKNREVELSALADRGELNADSFRRGAKLLQGHTGFLPKSTDGTGASSLLEDAFYDGDNHVWSVRPDDKQFRCDDHSDAVSVKTRHLIWFR